MKNNLSSASTMDKVMQIVSILYVAKNAYMLCFLSLK